MAVHRLVTQEQSLNANNGSLTHYRYFNLAGRGLNGTATAVISGVSAPFLLAATTIGGLGLGAAGGAYTTTSKRQDFMENLILVNRPRSSFIHS